MKLNKEYDEWRKNTAEKSKEVSAQSIYMWIFTPFQVVMLKAALILWRWASVCCSVCMTFSHPPSFSIPSSPSFVFVPWQVSHILPEHRAKTLLCIAPCGCLLICHLFSLHLASWLYPMTLFLPHSFYFISSSASPKPVEIFFRNLQKSSLLVLLRREAPRPEQTFSSCTSPFFSSLCGAVTIRA